MSQRRRGLARVGIGDCDAAAIALGRTRARRKRERREGSLTKKPSSPLSPPSLMVAANAGDAMRTVAAPTTAACEGANNERRQRFASDGGFSGRGPRRAVRRARPSRRATRDASATGRSDRTRSRATRSASNRASRARLGIERRTRVIRIHARARDRFFRDRQCAHLLEAVEGGDGGDSLLGGDLDGGLDGDGGAEEGGGHGGHFDVCGYVYTGIR